MIIELVMMAVFALTVIALLMAFVSLKRDYDRLRESFQELKLSVDSPELITKEAVEGGVRLLVAAEILARRGYEKDRLYVADLLAIAISDTIIRDPDKRAEVYERAAVDIEKSMPTLQKSSVKAPRNVFMN